MIAFRNRQLGSAAKEKMNFFNARSNILHRQFVARGFAGLMAIGALVVAVPNAEAWSREFCEAHWSSGHYAYKVNSASFPPRLQPLNTMTADQYLWWIQYGISQWKERTNGALVYPDYLGDTAVLANMNSADGTNLIAATTGCYQFDPYCAYYAVTQYPSISGCDPTTTIFESDVTFFDRNGSGFIQFRSLTNQEYHQNVPEQGFQGAMTHEAGHVFGLAHQPGAVMATPDPGQNLSRFPTGDDINGMRSAYPPSGNPGWFWRKLTPSGWSSQSASLPGWTYANPTAAIGAFGGTNASRVVVGCVGSDDLVYFTRASLPLGSGTTWTQSAASATIKSNRPPGIAARKNGSALWVAAWPNVWSYTSSPCPGATVEVSTNGFDSGALVNLPTVCTVQQIALTHDAQSDRFVMAYSRRNVTSIFGLNPQNDSLVMRTSSDGVTWSNEQPICSDGSGCAGGSRLLYGLDGVGIACGQFGRCLLTYHDDSGYDPMIKVRGFNVVAGTTSVDPASGGFPDRIQRTLPAAAAVDGFGLDSFLFAELWSTNPADWSHSRGALWVASSGTLPTTSWSWTNVNQKSKHAPALATGNQLYSDTYIFYTGL